MARSCEKPCTRHCAPPAGASCADGPLFHRAGSLALCLVHEVQDGGVIKTAVLLPADLNRLTCETDMFLATIDSLTDEEFAAPSTCEGWTRANDRPAEIKAALRTAIKNFADKAATLKDGLKAETVKTPGGASITPYAVPALRISEVVIHHADLDTAWGLGEADMDALEDALDIVVGGGWLGG